MVPIPWHCGRLGIRIISATMVWGCGTGRKGLGVGVGVWPTEAAQGTRAVARGGSEGRKGGQWARILSSLSAAHYTWHCVGDLQATVFGGVFMCRLHPLPPAKVTEPNLGPHTLPPVSLSKGRKEAATAFVSDPPSICLKRHLQNL